MHFFILDPSSQNFLISYSVPYPSSPNNNKDNDQNNNEDDSEGFDYINNEAIKVIDQKIVIYRNEDDFKGKVTIAMYEIVCEIDEETMVETR
jgi:hypothetical protein